MGIGYTIVLCVISIIREILGSGTITIWKELIININKIFNSETALPIFSNFFLTSSGAYLIIGLLFALFSTKEKTNENI